MIPAPPGKERRPVFVTVVGTNNTDSYRFARRDRPATAIEYVAAGNAMLQIQSYECLLVAGDVFILPAGTSHVVESTGVGPWKTLWFIVDGRLQKAVLGMYGLEGSYRVAGSGLRSVFASMVACARTTKDPRRLQAELDAFFYRVLIELSASGGDARLRLSAKALRGHEFVETHLERPVTLAEISGALGKSRSQTVRIFKRELGLTPYQYLIDRRIEAAKVLLASHNLPIKEIARQLCFSDAYYFSNAFRRRVGVSPSGYRGGRGQG